MNAKNARKRPQLLWVAAEIAPYATAGGLGEVVGVLAPALREAGWPIAVVLPGYPTLKRQRGLRPRAEHPLSLRLGRHHFDAIVREVTTPGGVVLYLLDCPELYEREGIYGAAETGAHADNPLRFGALSLASLEIVRLGICPAELLHVHDWPAALVPSMLATWYRDVPELAQLRVLLTIHNLAHGGDFGAELLEDLGLPKGLATEELMGHGSGINLLRGAIRFADRINTVSPHYAKEITRKEHGFGLDDALRERKPVLTGVLNGLDMVEWNPQDDDAIAKNYTWRSLAGKAECKAALRREFGLDAKSDEPLFIYVGRLVEQKGIDLLFEVLPALLEKGAQFVALGSGQPELEQGLRELRDEYPGRVGLHIGFDRLLVHRILAGGDMLLMPSRFEPCGITQMQSMRYGTVPVVHAVGGLLDTVDAITPKSLEWGKGTGFLFRSFTSRAFNTALGKARELFGQPKVWRGIQRRGMEADWSWAPRRAQYERLYERALKTQIRRFELEIPSPTVEEPREPDSVYIDWGPDLPERYGEDVLQLMVQSPTQLYAYWELSTESASRAREPVRLELLGEGGSHEVAAAVADLGEWWPQALPDHEYRVVLRDADDRILLESNAVRTPRDRESLRRDVRWVTPEERRLRWFARAGAMPIESGTTESAIVPRYPTWRRRKDEE